MKFSVIYEDGFWTFSIESTDPSSDYYEEFEITDENEAKTADIKEYFKKIYPSSVSENDLKELAGAYVEEHKRKMYLATKFPSMKICDIELLSQLVTDDEIEEYEKDFGN